MSFPIPDAIVVNSLLAPGTRPLDNNRCLDSALAESEVRLRIESTQDLNSFVRSWTGILSSYMAVV
jgi:hypothetical protein